MAVAQPYEPGDDYHRELRAVHAELGVTGAGACGGCHSGGVAGAPESKTGVAADLWKGTDFDGAHYTAFKTLHSDQSQTMARLLAASDGSQSDPTQRDDCLSCHAFGHDVPEDKRGAMFQIEDGVSCEACHGRSERWQVSHQYKNWHDKSAQQWLEAGMYDTRDLRRWAEKCLECHLGSQGRQVTHKMMGAGHPALTLELATDTFDVPKHWEDERTYLDPTEGPWYYARLWAVGQAVTLRETMARINAWANQGTAPPDFAFFDCYACHHEYLKTPSRLPGRGAPADGAAPPAVRWARLGQPAWDASAWVVARHLVNVLMPAEQEELGNSITVLFRSFRIHNADKQAVAQASASVARIADKLAREAVAMPFDRQKVRRILHAVTTDAEYIIAAGPHGADQAFDALNALYYLAWSASEDKPANDAAIVSAIKELKPLIYDDDGTLSMSRFDPGRFRNVMAQLAGFFKPEQ